MERKQEELARRLQEWCSNFADCPKVSKAQLRPLCRGNMVPIWNFFIERVQPKGSVREIRANLLVHQRAKETKKKEAEKEKLLAEREAARIANAQAKARLASLEHDVGVIRGRITETEEKVAKEREEKEMEKRQAMILGCYDVKIQGLIAVLKEYADRLMSISQNLSGYKERKGAEKYYPVDMGMGTNNGAVALETEGIRMVRLLVEAIAKHLADGDVDWEESVKKQLEEGTVRAVDVLPYVAELAAAAQKKLEDDGITGSPMGVKRVRSPGGKLSPQRGAGETVPKVAVALAAVRAEHNKRYLATLDAQNKAAALKAQTKDILDSITVPSSVPTHLVPRLRKLGKLEAKLAGEQQALQYVSQLGVELTAMIDRGSRHARPIQSQIKQMQEWQERVKNKEQQVAKLIRGTKQYDALLKKAWSTSNNGILEGPIAIRDEQIFINLRESMKNCIANEIALVQKAQPHSYHESKRYREKWDEEGKKAAKALGIPLFKSPAILSPQIVELKSEVRREEQLLTVMKRRTDIDWMQLQCDDSRILVQSLAEQAKAAEAQQQRVWKGVLAATRNEAQQALPHCDKIAGQIKEWREKPAFEYLTEEEKRKFRIV